MKRTIRKIAMAMDHFKRLAGLCIVNAVLMLTLVFTFQKANTQTPYNPGKLAVLVVGDGSAALSGSATPVFVKEFNITGAGQLGTLRTSFPTVAVSGTSSVNRALTQSGSSGSEGYVGLSTNRQLLLVTGYNSTSGSATVSSSVATTFPTNTRVIAKIDATGVADTKSTLFTSNSGSAIRSAASVDGTGYWTAGALGMFYVLNGNVAAPTNLTLTNTRVASIFNSQLYSSSGAAGFRMATLGTGLPTSGSPVLTNLNGFLTSTGDPYSHFFLDLNGGGPDVLYIASLSAAPSGLLKYTSSNNGATWSAAGSILGNVFGVTGVLNSCTGNVDLYITANTTNAKPNTLYRISDLSVTAGSPANITNNGLALNTFGTLLATAATNTAFGGVAFTPGTTLSAPSLFNVTGGNTCFGSAISIGLSNSETGINYELKKDGVTISTIPGTGAPLSFASQTAIGVYTIVATNILTGCTSNMVGSSVINTLPTVSISATSSTICAGESTNINLDFTGTGPWIYSINGATPVSTNNDPEVIPVSPSDTTIYKVTSFSDANCNTSEWIQVSTGSYHSIAIKAGGTLWAWGRNNPDGQLGDGTTTDKNIPIQIGTETNWSKIATTATSSFAIKTDGTLWAWGSNFYGQLGIGSNVNSSIPIQVGIANNWLEITGGNLHAMAIKNDGSLWGWGRNIDGQLGDGSNIDKNSPVQIGTDLDWVEISAGTSHSLGRKSNGKISSWGSNIYGQTGTGAASNVPVQLSGNNWASISAGADYSMSIKSNGSLFVWGRNNVGQLGIGSYVDINTPTQISGTSDWAKISASSSHSLGIKTNGLLFSWGLNNNGQLGNGTFTSSNIPVQMGTDTDWSVISTGLNNSTAIKTAGSLWNWGINNYGQLGDSTNIDKTSPVQLEDIFGSVTINVNALPVVSFSGLASAYCKNASPVTLTGTPGNGIFSGQGITGNTFDPGAVEDENSYDITYTYTDANGCTNSSTQNVTINGIPIFSFSGLASSYCITAGPVILTSSSPGIGSFSGTGITDNLDGTASFNPATAGAGGPYTVSYYYLNAITGCSNTYTQQVTVNAIPTATMSASQNPICNGSSANLLLNFTGTGPWSYSINGTTSVSTSNNPETVPLNPAVTTTYELTALSDANCNASEWIDVSAGSYHVLGIKSDGSLWSWGLNGDGQLGRGNTADTSRPVRIGNTNDWAMVSAGAIHSMALKKDGTLWTWGSNGFGRLGLGTSTGIQITPQQVGVDTDWFKVEAGNISSMALKSDGTLWGWGNNGGGILGDGTFAQRNSPVQVGTDTDWAAVSSGISHTLALKTNGTLWGWGTGGVGQLGGATPGNFPHQMGVQSDWASLIAGNNNSMAIKTTGTLWGWGWNQLGELGLGNNSQINSPTQVGVASNWQDISFFTAHSHGLKQDGTLWSWGNNQNGSFGTGSSSSSNIPVQAGTSTNWLKVTAGLRFGLGIRSDRTLWSWGINLYGQLGNGTFTDTLSPVQVHSPISSVTITVMPLPVVSFAGLSSVYCVNSQPVTLTGIPAGGVFSGTGISGDVFDPAMVGAGGPYTITYSYADPVTGCYNNSIQQVTILSSPFVSFTGLASQYCINAATVALTGSPSGGVFSGPGITENSFNPLQAGVGSHNIDYSYTGINGCSGFASQIVSVNLLPVVNFEGLPGSVCENDTSILLTGSPSGGVFSGPGISGNIFTPSIPGAGIHSITYTYTDVNGCSNSSSRTVTVKSSPGLPVISGNLCQGSLLTVNPTSNLASLAWNLNGTTVSTTIASAGSIPMIVAGGNGSGSTANRLNDPTGVYVDKLGNIYIADNNNHRIQKWAPGATSGVTVAGGNGQGSAANQLNTPFGVTVDVSGNIFVADTYNHRIQKWAPGATSGVTVAGGNAAGSGMDQLNTPTGVFIDDGGNIFIADIVNHRIQKWLPGSIAGITVAGGNGQGSSMNQLDNPAGIFVDDSGNIFIADQRNHRIQKWATGALSGLTVAGGNGIGASAATLNYPAGVFVDQAGMIYIADRFNNRVQKWVPGAASGITIAGGFGSGVSVYHLLAPFGVFVDGNGNVIVTDSNDRIMKRSQVVNNQYNTQSSGAYTVTATGFNGCSVSSLPVIVNPLPAVSFSGLPAYCCPTTPAVTLTGSPAGGTFSGWGINGNIFDPAVAGPGTHYINYTFTDLNGCTNTKQQVVTINSPSEIYSENMCAGKNLTAFPTNGVSSMIWYLNGLPVSTVTATGVANGNTVAGGNGPGAGADELSSPYGVSLDISGNVYVADVENHRIQKWAPGSLSGVTVAGGNGDGSGPGQFSYPYALYVDVDGNVYVADLYNFRIQKWAPGAISGVTVAGGNGQGSAPNQIGSPYGVVVDGTGNIYIADPENYRIQKWGPGATSGTTAAGGNGNGSASNQLSNPTGLCLDAAGNIYIADALNNRIQKWVPGATSGITVAGGNGPGAAANQLNYPNAVSVDNSGNIYVTDNGNNRVQKWAPGATSGITVAGGNGAGSSTNQLDNPYGLSLDGGGNMYIADITNHRIQQWQQTIFDSLPNPVAGVYTVSVTSFSGCNSTSASFTVNPLPQISFSGLSATYCVNDHKVTLTGNPSGGTFSGPGISGNEFDPASAGSGGPYTITYSYSDPETGCSNTYTQNVTVFGLPTISVTASHTLVCSGSPVTLSASGASTYSWMPGGLTGSSIIVNPDSTTTYTVTGTDGNGCSTSPGWMDVSGGLYHSLGVKKDGSLWAWGYNLYGQLGIDDYSNKNIPVQIGAATNWKKVSGGGLFSVGIRSDGTLWAWGENNSGQLGDGTNMPKYVPVQVGSSTDWKEISAGDYHCLAIKTNGTLWAWGDNSTGQLGDGTNMTKYVPVQIGSANNWSKVSSGQLHSIAIKSDGTLWSWGSNEFGQLGDGSLSDKNTPVQIGSSTDWANVSAGASHNTGIKSDGTLWAWGWNYYGQLGNGNNTDSNIPVQVGSSTDWKITSGGANESAAKKSDGTLWAWGSNIAGQLGNGTNNNTNIPVQVGTETNWSVISSGYAHSLGIKSDGNLWAWGDNWAGQLGDRTNTSLSIPNQIGSSSVSISITVDPLPVVSFSGLPSVYCANDPSLTLTGIPAGGTFSGPGITGNTFNPALAGTGGPHIITYTYTDPVTGCSNTSTHSITISCAEALAFDGVNDNVTLPNSLAVSATAPSNTAITIEYWFKGSNVQSAVRLQDDNGYIVAGWNSSGQPIHIISTDNSINGVGINPIVNNGNWHHVAMTWEKNTILGFKSYVDGQLYAQRNSSNVNLPVISNGANLGSYRSVGEFMNGQLDEVRIWNRALCQEEILSNMNCEIPGAAAGLLANYHFNHGVPGSINTGINTLSDVSSNNYNGVLNNFALSGTVSNWIAPGAVISGVSCSGIIAAQEINVQGNAVSIADNNITPTVTDHTDFGNVISGGSLVRTFTIQNTGTASLAISGITMAGINQSMFTVGPLTPASPIAAGNSAVFTVTFSATSTGVKTATVVIGNNDCNESVYDFAVEALSECPAVSFTGLAATYCSNAPSVTLTGNPIGGIFSGPGITGNVFDPANAGVGTHNIQYTYSDGYGCSNSETKQVLVSICTPAYTTLNLTAFLEGFYYDINTMRANIYDLGISTDPAETDTVTVNLWAPASLSNAEPDHTVKSVLHTDGTATMQFPSVLIGNQFYIAVKHRNHLETWSKLPVTFSSNTDYDFTDNLQKAYDDGVNPPMSAVAGNKFAFYGGEVNQDGTVDASDMADVDNDNAVFAFGYNATDASGDGTTDASDISIVDNNQALFLFYARPY